MITWDEIDARLRDRFILRSRQQIRRGPSKYPDMFYHNVDIRTTADTVNKTNRSQINNKKHKQQSNKYSQHITEFNKHWRDLEIEDQRNT